MKHISMGLLAGWLAFQAGAAESDWMTDFAAAKKKAKDEKRMVLMDFTGSDWCPPCKALKKNVLSSAPFLDYARKNLVLVEVDFPRSKPQSDALKRANSALQDKFNVEAFPTIVVLDSAGRELSKKAGYGGEDPAEFIAALEKLRKK